MIEQAEILEHHADAAAHGGQRLGDLIGSPCGIGGALFPLLGLMAATTPGAGFSGQVMGLGFVGMGLAQRLFGGDACRR